MVEQARKSRAKQRHKRSAPWFQGHRGPLDVYLLSSDRVHAGQEWPLIAVGRQILKQPVLSCLCSCHCEASVVRSLEVHAESMPCEESASLLEGAT